MVTEAQVQQTVVRCVTCMSLYFRRGKARQVEAVMSAELQAAADLVRHWGVTGDVLKDAILSPVESALRARHGSEAGRRLNTEFVRAFKPSPAAGSSLPARSSFPSQPIAL